MATQNFLSLKIKLHIFAPARHHGHILFNTWEIGIYVEPMLQSTKVLWKVLNMFNTSLRDNPLDIAVITWHSWYPRNQHKVMNINYVFVPVVMLRGEGGGYTGTHICSIHVMSLNETIHVHVFGMYMYVTSPQLLCWQLHAYREMKKDKVGLTIPMSLVSLFWWLGLQVTLHVSGWWLGRQKAGVRTLVITWLQPNSA